MKIEIQTSEELNILLDALAKEIVKANDYYRLFRNLVTAMPSHEREFLQSNTFWTLTLDAIRDSYMGWPVVIHKDQRAITQEEHQRFIAAEVHPERKALYQRESFHNPCRYCGSGNWHLPYGVHPMRRFFPRGNKYMVVKE
jgi:hypothetical protein